MLEVEQVNRSFGAKRVLRDVSFTVDGGRMTGFVGANGAGKTTTMRIILGVLSADSGRVALNGSDLGDADRRRFGYMPEERGLYPKMKVAEQIIYLARLHGLAPAAAQKNTMQLLERLGLEERADTAVEALSLGNQQRAQIAAALVHDPEILVLDEPFSGLDPIAVETVQGVLKERAAAGVPVLFSSHQLDIVERLCDDLIVIADGDIRASGSRERLRAEFGGSRYELHVSGSAEWVRGAAAVEVVSIDGGRTVFSAAPDAAQAVLRAALDRGPVVRFAPQEPSLAQIFREVIQ
ncbi:ABC-2 type transport system ATP-binding protein [Cryobacterium mesophilum]|uniref:ATP-binding cassette domain-containing protein n=1 Tax=Terrimesophilobacter mesophilus TaxID=433647 RepID=A0A4R8VBN7_9MICO|nr:ATP-binding cassette domain-containing protein [Terrimesophilobacter mesophilus]MBB5633041.1 ABC-2 type transport system ATP-binding protein [Terrimesophilobacter mesophilus]TFB79806.1 ATP-binding cassette domain-containing protein [Terrimesophilobacter mesophilus]